MPKDYRLARKQPKVQIITIRRKKNSWIRWTFKSTQFENSKYDIELESWWRSFCAEVGKKFQRDKKTKNNHDEFLLAIDQYAWWQLFFFFLKMIYAVSCQEENSRQKGSRCKKISPKLCKVDKKQYWCLGMIHMILVSVETQSCND